MFRTLFFMAALVVGSISFASNNTNNCSDFSGIYQSQPSHDCGGLTCIDITLLAQKDCSAASLFKKKIVLNSSSLPPVYGGAFDLHPENVFLSNKIVANGQWNQDGKNSFSYGEVSKTEISNLRFTNYDVGMFQKARLVDVQNKNYQIEYSSKEPGHCQDGYCSPPSKWSNWQTIESWKKLDKIPDDTFKSPSNSFFNAEVLLKNYSAGWKAHRKSNFYYSCNGSRDNLYFKSKSIIGEDGPTAFETSDKWLLLDNRLAPMLASLDKSKSYICEITGEKPSNGAQLTGELVIYNMDKCQIFKAPSCCTSSEDLLCD